jgi:O-antigen/teichoic acid export membrane protein
MTSPPQLAVSSTGGNDSPVAIETLTSPEKPKVRGPHLARNTFFNLVGQLAPMFIAVVTIPIIVKGLGTDRFGILSIAWLILGYFGFLDLGLGRAATKFIAESLASGDHARLPSLVWTCAGLQAALGAFGGVILALTVPYVVTRFVSVQPGLMAETQRTILLLAMSLPFVLATNGFRAVLEAAQRFDLVNFLRIPATSSIYLLPAVGVYLGFNLPGIVILLIVARIIFCIAHMWCCFIAIPNLPLRPAWGGGVLMPMLRYGGWVTVANLINPFLLYLDRFMVGTFLSLSLLGFYTVPLEAVSRLLIVPVSLASTLFPVFSGIGLKGDVVRITNLYSRSFKYLLLILGPFAFLIAAFSHDILLLWMGAAFAAKTSFVLQILAFGILFNSFAHIPFGFLQSIGRPDLATKILLLEVPLYIPLAWFLVKHFGIQGAAAGWAIRVAIESVVFIAAVIRVCHLSVRQFLEHGLLQTLAATAILGGGLAGWSFLARELLWLRLSGAALLVAAFAWVVWAKVLDAPDRRQIFSILPTSIRTTRLAVALSESN